MTPFSITLKLGAGIVGLALVSTLASAQNRSTEPSDTPLQNRSQSDEDNATDTAPGAERRSSSRRDEDAAQRRDRDAEQRQSEPLDQPSEPGDSQDSRTDPLVNPGRERTQTEATEADVEAEAQRGQFLRASSIVGMPVRGSDGATLGSVADVLIDPNTSNISYVLIDRDGGPVSPELPVVPWTLFQTNVGSVLNLRYLSAPLTMDRLQTAPISSMTDTNLAPGGELLKSVDAYYSTEVRQAARPDLDATETRSGTADNTTITPGIGDTPSTIRDRRRSSGTATNPRSRPENLNLTTDRDSSGPRQDNARSRPSTGSLERDRTDGGGARGSRAADRTGGGKNAASGADRSSRGRQDAGNSEPAIGSGAVGGDGPGASGGSGRSGGASSGTGSGSGGSPGGGGGGSPGGGP